MLFCNIDVQNGTKKIVVVIFFVGMLSLLFTNCCCGCFSKLNWFVVDKTKHNVICRKKFFLLLSGLLLLIFFCPQHLLLLGKKIKLVWFGIINVNNNKINTTLFLMIDLDLLQWPVVVMCSKWYWIQQLKHTMCAQHL